MSEVPDEASDLLVPPIASSFPEGDSVFFFVGHQRGHPSRTLVPKVLVSRLDRRVAMRCLRRWGSTARRYMLPRQPSQAAISAPTILAVELGHQ
ncbi:hypothetical protein AYO39_01875 [Actinobacteria bacterium SCGC AG-212-D09]|nr:hypothetical protein AYO39_01875 [Actinobacteria bacterium SCGC AG-212-D09]